MANRGPSFSKLQIILQRQGGTPKWGSSYQPANALGDVDAPSSTRPSELFAPLLGRGVHAQAKTERAFILLALHCSKLFELHEQKMLPFNPSAHPLFGNPIARGLDLPPLRGTLAVSDQMGRLSWHAQVRVPPGHSTLSGQVVVPYPYIGDMLLYMTDESGPWCVNWSIKAEHEDFHRTYNSKKRPPTAKDRERAEYRHKLEKDLYLDGRIPTHHLVPNEIDRVLRINLKTLHYWWARDPENPAVVLQLEAEILDWYREKIPTISIQFDLAKACSSKFGISIYDAKWVLKKGIFSREIRVDLFRTVLDNLPLFPEYEDPFVRYAAWFARG